MMVDSFQVLIGAFFILFWMICIFSIKQNNERWVPAFFCKSPRTIKYSDKPIYYTQNYQIVSTQFIANLSGLTQWTDCILLPNHYKKIKMKTIDLELTQKIKERLENPLHSLVLCKIDEVVGKGVFLSHDANVIPKDTIIGLYAGKLLDYKTQQDPTYLLFLRKKFNYFYHCKEFIDTLKYGNITRFIQDLPSVEEMEKMHLEPDILTKIATENLAVRPGFYHGIPIQYLIAIRDINPMEQLGFSYRGNYWKYRIKKRRIFNHQGVVIGQFLTPTKIMLN